MWTQLTSLISGKTRKWNAIAKESRIDKYRRIAGQHENIKIFLTPAIEIGNLLVADFAAPYAKSPVVALDIELISLDRFSKAHSIAMWTLVCLLMMEKGSLRPKIVAAMNQSLSSGEEEQSIEILTRDLTEENINQLSALAGC